MPISPERVRELADEAGFDLVRFGPADPGPQHARMVAATAACSLDDAAGPALPPPRVPGQRDSVVAEAEHGGGGDGSIGRETTLEQ